MKLNFRKKIKKMHSMRNRIIKSMMLTNLITIILLGTMLFGFFMLLVTGVGTMMSTMSGDEIARFIGSPMMLNSLGMNSVEEMLMDEHGREIVIRQIEYHNKIDLFELLDEDKIVERTHFGEEDRDFIESDEIFEVGIDSKIIQMLGFRLYLGDELIYENDGNLKVEDKFLSTFLDTYSEVELENPRTGEIFGILEVQIHRKVLNKIILIVSIIFIVICLVTFIVAFFISNLITIPITRPIKKLYERLGQIALEDMEWAIHKKIEFRNPLFEISQLTDATNNILQKMRTYSETLEQQYDELEAQNGELESMSSDMKTINKGLNIRNQQMDNILNNVGQGFLAIGVDLLIENEYSKECENIFEEKIYNKKLSTLLYPLNMEEQDFLDSILTKILDGGDPEIYVPLLPDIVNVNKKDIKLVYSVIEDRINKSIGIMVVMSDITDQVVLNKQMELEKTKLQMVVKIVGNRQDFISLYNDYSAFATEGIAELFESDISCEQKAREMFRIVHSFKGNLSQYDLMSTIEKLHFFEDYLSDIISNQIKSESPEQCISIQMIDMMSWIQEDMEILVNYLGEEFFEASNVYRIEKYRIDQIEEKMKRVLSMHEYQQIIPLVNDLKHMPIKELFLGYPDYVNKLAERMGKEIHDLEIYSDDIRTDIEHYRPFVKSLIHVFRNMIDHGIEDLEERFEAEKSEVGILKCSIYDKGDNIEIELFDDGRGIDLDLVRRTLENNGVSEDEINRMSDDELYKTLLIDGFTTREKVTYVSGRGVGMAAVNETTEKIGGKLFIESQLGVGTTIRFVIPKLKEKKAEIMENGKMFEIFKNQTNEFLENTLKIDLPKNNPFIKQSHIKLNEFTSLVNFHGAQNGLFLISLNRNIAIDLVEQFVLGSYNEDELEELIQETVGEISNILIGNLFQQLTDTGDYLNIGTPVMLFDTDATIKYSDSLILSNEIEIGEYKITMGIVNLDKGFQEVL